MQSQCRHAERQTIRLQCVAALRPASVPERSPGRARCAFHASAQDKRALCQPRADCVRASWLQRQRRVVTRVPVELNEARHGLNRDALICEAFDFKYKTRMAGVDNWNAANNASHTQIAAFQRVWQKTRQAKMGAPGGSAITR